MGNHRNRRRTKIRLFKTLIRPVLLNGCETWKITKEDERKLNSFQCQCLRKILRIRWQQRMTNKRVGEIAETREDKLAARYGVGGVTGEDMYSGERERMTVRRTALRWTTEDRRARGRPKITWRTVEKERIKEGWMSWNEAAQNGKMAAQVREN